MESFKNYLRNIFDTLKKVEVPFTQFDRRQPRGYPRVLDKEVVKAILSTITGSEDSVFKLNITVLGDDTRGVFWKAD